MSEHCDSPPLKPHCACCCLLQRLTWISIALVAAEFEQRHEPAHALPLSVALSCAPLCCTAQEHPQIENSSLCAELEPSGMQAHVSFVRESGEKTMEKKKNNCVDTSPRGALHRLSLFRGIHVGTQHTIYSMSSVSKARITAASAAGVSAVQG